MISHVLSTTADVTALVLAAVFLVSGIAKLLSNSGLSELLRRLGISKSFVPPAFAAVVLSELTLSGGLLAGYAWAPLGATAFLVAASLVLVVARSRGHNHGCGCFGMLDAHSLSRSKALFQASLIGAALFLMIYARINAVHGFWEVEVEAWPIAASLIVGVLGLRVARLAILSPRKSP